MVLKPSEKPIAIIGMAGIFPQAKNLAAYWQNILNQTDCITDVPASRWEIEEYYDADPHTPDKTYSKRGGFLPEIDFNPLEFGLPPNILKSTDTSQILSLIVARDALQDAGYGKTAESIRQRTGVVLGACLAQKLVNPLTKRLEYPVWEKVLKSNGISDTDTQKIVEQIKLAYLEWDENTFPGLLGNVIAGRIANRLDLGGMNCVVDAACASSLGALQMALSELREHRSDMMISGGVDTDNSVFAYMCFSKTPALSRQDATRPFDASSDGMLLGEGIGMVVLKRLEDAERDGDRIYAVIRGLGASSDGKYKSIYAPRSSGQALALQRAYEDAGFAPETVGLLEAHGTGTKAGDVAEITGLKQVFGADSSTEQHIALGSVKSQIGHTKAAAGTASLIKAALALHHKVLPPTINVSQPNPKLELDRSPFYLNTQTRPWFQGIDNIPRRAGVSSFGFGGSNYHAVLEEYQGEEFSSTRLHDLNRSILLHALNPQLLLAKCEAIQTDWESESSEASFEQIADTSLSVKIPLSASRLGFVAASLTEARNLLATAIKNLDRQSDRPWEHPQGIYYRPAGVDVKGKVVALFPGQGSQYLEMGKTLTINFPELRQAYSQMDSLLAEDGLTPISSVVFPPPTGDRDREQNQSQILGQTENSQPAIGVFSVGLYKILQQAGFKPDFVAGHSFGELTALWAGGVLSDRDYFFLAKARGQAMSSASLPQGDFGKMLAVQGKIELIERAIANLPNVAIVNWNSSQQLVVAGNSQSIIQAKQLLEQSNYQVTLLPVSAAFHTNLVSHAQNKFARAVSQVTFRSPKIPVYSNTTTQAYPQDVPRIEQQLLEQILEPVKFQQEIEQIYRDGGSIFVEFGARSILTNLVKDILADKPHVAVALNPSRSKDSDRAFREAVIKLRVTGLKLDNGTVNRICEAVSFRVNARQQSKSEIASAETKSGLTLKVTGCNYGSQQRKDKFLAALADNQKPPGVDSLPTEKSLPELPTPELPTPELPTQQLSQSQAIAKSQINMTKQQPSNNNTLKIDLNNSVNSPSVNTPVSSSQQNVSNSLEIALMKFQEHQSEVNKAQQQYLQNQREYTKQFFQLLRETYSAKDLADSSTPQDNYAIQSDDLESRSAANGAVGYQVLPEDLPSLDKPLENKEISTPQPLVVAQENVVTANLAIEKEKEEEVAEDLTPTEAVANINLAILTQSLLEIVSDKTGYPVEMLELEMDMEADLGIDSIKRVEILGAIQESFPDLPPVDPEDLMELRTLSQIATYMANREEQDSADNNLVTHNKPADINGSIPTSATKNGTNSKVEDIRQSILNIIGAKTGYAPEVIEGEMDLATDLGVNWDTKQEVATSIASLYPNLGNKDEILQLPTPDRIVEYLYSKKKSLISP